MITKTRENCVFYDKHFLDDLQGYSFVEENGAAFILYDDNTRLPVTINSNISSIISSEYASVPNRQKDVWYPVFLNLANNKINSRFLFKGSVQPYINLGIDEAISFPGKFRSWSIIGSSTMSCDWHISASVSTNISEYGLLCWIQDSSRKVSDIKIDDIPVGAMFKIKSFISYVIEVVVNGIKKKKTISISPSDVLYKIDKDNLQIINNGEIRFNLGKFNFLDKNKAFNLSTYLEYNYPRGSSEPEARYNERIDLVRSRIFGTLNSATTTTNIISNSTILFIPKGDVYSYFEDTQTKAISRIASSTYLSATLHQEYREIYNILTINQQKINGSALKISQVKLLQKIAMFLASYPLIDRTTISILLSEQAQTIINDFINLSVGNNVPEETRQLKLALIKISELFKNLSSNIKYNQNTSGYCFSTTDIIKNLIGKYGSYLNIGSTNTTLSYTPRLKYGPHVKINQDIISKVSTSISNAVVYNNFVSQIGPFTLQSAITANQTYFSVYDTRSRSPRVNIPLWDINKRKILNITSKFTAGDDFIINYDQKIKEIGSGDEIQFRMDVRDLGLQDELIPGEDSQILWSRISGPDCLRFSDSNRSFVRGINGGFIGNLDLKYQDSTVPYPTLFIKSIGKYILRLKVSNSFGVFYDRVTLYVVNANGEYAPGQRPPLLNKATLVNIAPTNGIVSICPHLREFAIGKQGIFWPIYSDLSTFDTVTNPYGKTASFGGDLRKYAFDLGLDANGKKSIINTPVPLSLSYIPNNTKMQISRIILSHMMDNNNECYNCGSFFKTIIDNKGFTLDVDSSFFLTDENNARKEFNYPQDVSSDYTKIISYGGYSPNLINNDLGISIPYHPSPSSILPNITGMELTNDSFPEGRQVHLCHLKRVDAEKPMVFEKGCFHPSYGWLPNNRTTDPRYRPYINSLYNNFINKTAVINFKPEYRKTFIFKGPGFFYLDNANSDIANPNHINTPNIYFSSIELRLAEEAQECYGVGDLPCSESERAEKEREEVADQYPHLGYRTFNITRISQFNNQDEFASFLNVEPADASPSEDYCTAQSAQAYEAAYVFPRKGKYLPDNQRSNVRRFSRDILQAKIEDIEVEIAFMNYVNTKNLIIWLDVLPCAGITEKLYPRKNSDTQDGAPARDRWSHISKNLNNSIYFTRYDRTKAKIDSMQNGPLKSYLKALFEMNDNPDPRQTILGQTNSISIPDSDTTITLDPTDESLPKSPIFRLYLLNQEHIEGNGFNFSIKFSDLIHKNTQPFDSNNIAENIDPSLIKAVEKDGIVHLLPTLSPFGYSDNDINFFRQIIQSNNLHTLNNRFAKFSGMDLFTGAEDKLGFGRTKFSLGIAVLNPSDMMSVSDNVYALDQKTNTDSSIVKSTADLLNNSICCWNLILHINTNGSSRFLPSDILGNIQYYQIDPKIYGYNFIANFDNKKYLLPPVNINAPYGSTLDPEICRYSKEKLNAPKYNPVPFSPFPFLIVNPQASLVGALAEIASVDAQLDQMNREFYDYFRDLRYARQAELFFNNLYVSKYDKYAMGGSDKALLSVSYDDTAWYMLEASIFKYGNCPIVKKRRYNYMKLNHVVNKSMSIFPFSTISKLDDIINEDNIKIISIPLTSLSEATSLRYETIELAKVNLDNQVVALQQQIDRIVASNPTSPTLDQLYIRLKELVLLVSLHTETMQSIGAKIKKFDIVQIKKTIINQARNTSHNATLAGTYIVDENNTLVPISTVPGVIQYNKLISVLKTSSLLDFSFNLIPNPDPEERIDIPFILSNKLISLSGLIPFHFFDKDNDVVTIRSKYDLINELRSQNRLDEADQILQTIKTAQKALESEEKKPNPDPETIKRLKESLWLAENILIDNKIIAKGYTYLKGSYKTILELQNPIIGYAISKRPADTNSIIIYDAKYTTVQDSKTMPANMWGLTTSSNSTILKDSAVESTISTFGEGSYGTGSMLVSPPTISRKKIDNYEQPLNERLGIDFNFKTQTVVADFYDKNQNLVLKDFIDAVIGYSYSNIEMANIRSGDNYIDLSTKKIAALFNKSPIFFRDTNDMAFMNLKFEKALPQNIPDYGEIELDISLDFGMPIYKLNSTDLSIINSRLSVLLRKRSIRPNCQTNNPNLGQCLQNYWTGVDPSSLFINDLYFYLENINSVRENVREQRKSIATARLRQLLIEMNFILFYCDAGQAVANISRDEDSPPSFRPSPSVNIGVPINKIEISTESDGSLSFKEIYYAANDYWINIDPEQSCSLDRSAMPKILLKTEYTCQMVNDYLSSDMRNICPKSAINIINGIDESMENNSTNYIYRSSTREINRQKSLYPNTIWPVINPDGSVTDGETLVVDRSFFINAYGKERNQLVTSRETYVLPKIFTPKTPPDGQVGNKVKNIFNLDNINNLKVRFRRIPRKLSKIDTHHEKYNPNEFGQLTKSLLSGPGGPFYPDLQFWYCINTRTGSYIDPPKYFKWLNEMIFRAYYGSIDGAEHRGSSLSSSKEYFDWLPYDYM
jgi:hypothetical protein